VLQPSELSDVYDMYTKEDKVSVAMLCYAQRRVTGTPLPRSTIANDWVPIECLWLGLTSTCTVHYMPTRSTVRQPLMPVACQHGSPDLQRVNSTAHSRLNRRRRIHCTTHPCTTRTRCPATVRASLVSVRDCRARGCRVYRAERGSLLAHSQQHIIRARWIHASQNIRAGGTRMWCR
jgi:hypothetical protein